LYEDLNLSKDEIVRDIFSLLDQFHQQQADIHTNTIFHPVFEQDAESQPTLLNPISVEPTNKTWKQQGAILSTT
jgi:hypothetical protein